MDNEDVFKAIITGNIEWLNYLINGNIENINMINIHGYTPLSAAICKNNIDMVKLLLGNQHQKIEYAIHNIKKENIFHMIAKYGNMEILILVIDFINKANKIYCNITVKDMLNSLNNECINPYNLAIFTYNYEMADLMKEYM